MEPSNRRLDTPYTKQEIDIATRSASKDIQESLISVVSAYLTEYQGYTKEWTAENVPKVLPVICALMQDALMTGQSLVEQQVAAMMLQTIRANTKMPMSASNIQN